VIIWQDIDEHVDIGVAEADLEDLADTEANHPGADL